MIVMAEREFLAPHQLKPGHEYHIDSGLGGSWTVIYTGVENGRHKFHREAKPDWPATDFAYKHEEIEAGKVFVHVVNYSDAIMLTLDTDDQEERRRRSKIIINRQLRLGKGEIIWVDKETHWLCTEARRKETDWND